MQNNNVIFRFSDIDLATYLVCKGCQFKNVQFSFNKRYAEYKVFVLVEGDKNLMIMAQSDFNKQKKVAKSITNFTPTKEFILSEIAKVVKEN